MGKKSKNEPKKSYIDCYYMSDKEITVANIYEAVKSFENVNIEYWEAAGVIEIELGEKSSIDIETLQMFKSEDDKAFLEKNNVLSVFGIKTTTDNMDKLKKIFGQIIESVGGFVCSDSDNFMPIIVK